MNLREAANEFVRDYDEGDLGDLKHYARALRAALAEDERDWSLLEATQESLREHMAEIQRLRAALAQPAASGEPVAWMYTGIKQDGSEHGPHLVWSPGYMDAMSASKGVKATPLYTAPPQRKPLSEEEIAKCWHDTPWNADLKTRVFAFARAIEAAHGIKDEND